MYQREMVFYTRKRSLRCWRARRFLGRNGYRLEVVDAPADPGVLVELSDAAHREVALPYVFVDRRPPGGRHGHGEGAGRLGPVRAPAAGRSL